MTTATQLTHGPAHLIGGIWSDIPGDSVRSHNPAHPARVVWSGSPSVGDVDAAVGAARAALPAWSRTTMEGRVRALRRFQEIAKARKDDLAELICEETGKAMWESAAEAGLIAGKVDITLEEGPRSGRHRVETFEFDLGGSKTARCHFRPHGVMAVVGPYNFPAHLPNGHIVPALLTGNTVVFKPSDKAPAVGQMLAEMFDEALRDSDAPAGVVNLVQGRADVASRLVSHDGIDGILFTGSWPVGRKILEANLDRPGRIVALEMGGNNPAVIMPDADLYQAVVEVVRCAFNTTGQRCTSTRRLIVHEQVADRVIPAIVKAASSLVIGDPRSDQPVFMGPIISEEARSAVFAAERRFAERGGRVILESTAVPGLEGWYLTPSIVGVDRFALDADDSGCDEEVFGPMLRIATVKSLDEAIEQANATRYGLSASIFTADQAAQERFLTEARAGCVNINCGTAGASSKLPFGGLGFSGNHRPAGAFSMDYCAYPVATMIEAGDAATVAQGMRVEREWVG
ncbi:MAG: aldehyde dehydrogenase family protein [Phycisphaerales bacterium]|nr:aldehyde dehydrogenase family protein [Planctomycetota bacterium]MCH8507579.1 aldehyde dehydrogenase family protein [Phycisphaerales bacterium]